MIPINKPENPLKFMKILIPLTLFLCGCGPMGLKAVDDFIEGEARVAEDVAEDFYEPRRATPGPSFF